jgi:peroxiredoxin
MKRGEVWWVNYDPSNHQNIYNRRSRIEMRIKTIMIFLLLFLLYSISAIAQTGIDSLKIGDEAPKFFLRDLNDQEVYLSDYSGKKLRQPWKNKEKHVIIVSFFATWCEPCKKEIPHLKSIYNEYKDKKVKIFMIDVGEEKDVVEPFVKEYGIEMPVLLDKYNAAAEKYQAVIKGLAKLPRLFVIDQEGIIRMKKMGFHDEQEFVGSIKGLLEELLTPVAGQTPVPK